MNKKGFSLVEMLGIIIILSILFLISFAAIDQRLEKERDILYSVQLNEMKINLEDWSLDDIRLRPLYASEIIYLTLAQLKYAGYVDRTVENPKTSKPFANYMTFKISLTGRKYNYEIIESTIADTKDKVDNVITLKGDPVEVYSMTGAGYIDPGYTATSGLIDATDDVNVSGIVNLSTKGVYQITYSLGDTKVIRNVIVR